MTQSFTESQSFGACWIKSEIKCCSVFGAKQKDKKVMNLFQKIKFATLWSQELSCTMDTSYLVCQQTNFQFCFKNNVDKLFTKLRGAQKRDKRKNVLCGEIQWLEWGWGWGFLRQRVTSQNYFEALNVSCLTERELLKHLK